MNDHDTAPVVPTGGYPAAMVSYRKLLDLETRMVEIKGALDAVLMLRGAVDAVNADVRDHELRLVALEQLQSNEIAKKSVWVSIRTFLYGVGSALGATLLAVLAGGYLAHLPKLWGG